MSIEKFEATCVNFDEFTNKLLHEVIVKIDAEYQAGNLKFFVEALTKSNKKGPFNFEKFARVKLGYWDGYVIGPCSRSSHKPSGFLIDAMCRELHNRASMYFNQVFKQFLLARGIVKGTIIQYPKSVYVLSYNPYLPHPEGNLSVVHHCKEREKKYLDGYVHRPALRLRCDHCGARVDKKIKATALLKLKMAKMV